MCHQAAYSKVEIEWNLEGSAPWVNGKTIRFGKGAVDVREHTDRIAGKLGLWMCSGCERQEAWVMCLSIFAEDRCLSVNTLRWPKDFWTKKMTSKHVSPFGQFFGPLGTWAETDGFSSLFLYSENDSSSCPKSSRNIRYFWWRFSCKKRP
jgi:hypothetical protein